MDNFAPRHGFRHPDHLDRRRVLRSLGLVALGAPILSACGSGDEGSGATTSSGSAAGSAKRTITGTMRGSVANVPANPQRIVALWKTGAELADLGIVPVGTITNEYIENELAPQTYAKVSKVPVIGSYEGVEIEKVIQLKPDLIVGMDRGEINADYDALAKIAPVVIFKIAEPTDVWDNYPKLANAVGRRTNYTTENAKLNKQLADIKAKHGAALGALQTTVINGGPEGPFLSTSKSLDYRRVNAAGFGYSKTLSNNPKRYIQPFALEQIPSLANQDIILYAVGIDGKPNPAMQKVLDSASFKRLPAVQKKNVFPLTSGLIFTFEAAAKQVADLGRAASAYKA